MNTDEVLFSMLQENTGKLLCDSGDYYGRGYERWAKLTLAQALLLPDGSYEAHVNSDGTLGLMGWLNMFKYLRRRLYYEADLTSDLRTFEFDDDTVSYLASAQRWAEQVGTNIRVGNTCNDGCSVLDGNFWWCEFERGGVEYIIISTHNGCDVLSGYSRPHVFQPTDNFVQWDQMMYDAGNKDACLSLHCAGNSIEYTHFRANPDVEIDDSWATDLPAIAGPVPANPDTQVAYVHEGKAYVPLVYLEGDEEHYFGHELLTAFDELS